MDFTNLAQHHTILLATLRLRSIPPVIVSVATDLEHPTHSRPAKLILMSSDKAVLHPSSLAKYAAAFFKLSRSSLTFSVHRSFPAACLRRERPSRHTYPTALSV